MKIKTRETTDGIQIMLLYRIREKLLGSIVLIFIILVPPLLFTIPFYLMQAINATVAAIIMFSAFFVYVITIRLATKNAQVELEPNSITIVKKGMFGSKKSKYEIRKGDTIVLKRTFIVIRHRGKRGRVKSTEYLPVWTILYRQNSGEEHHIFESRRNDYVEFNEFAERIAEYLQIDMIDHTGIKPIIIKAGSTDKSIKELKREIGANIQQEFREFGSSALGIHVEEAVDGIRVNTEQDRADTNDVPQILGGAIMLAVGLLVAYFALAGVIQLLYSDSPLSIRVVISLLFCGAALVFAFVGYRGFHLIDSVTSQTTVTITNENLQVINANLLTKKASKISLATLERMLIVQKGDKFYIEAVADQLRITILDQLDLNQATQITNIIIEAIGI